MKKILVAVSGVAVMGLVAGSAQAQCSFNSPGKAKGIKSSMVRAFAGCGSSSTFGGSNNTTMDPFNTPSCSTPVALSAYKLDSAKGKCDFKSGQKAQVPCSDGQPNCAVLSVSVKCSGMLTSSNTPVSTGDGDWTLSTFTRATLADPQYGDQTVIDFPLPFVMGAADKGKLSFKSDSTVGLADLLGPGSAIPACSSVEILNVAIQDPDGGIFARLGSATK